MQDSLNSPLIQRAMELAAIKHYGQWRKHPAKKIPYIAHPACVGIILAKAGYGDEVIAAGILHDVVEDCGVKLEELADEFSPRLARWVDQVSEPGKNISWAGRKEAYVKKLETADKEALAIAAADHLHNLESLKAAFLADSKSLDMFRVDIGQKMENEKVCSALFLARLGGPLAQEFTASLEAFEKMIPKMI